MIQGTKFFVKTITSFGVLALLMSGCASNTIQVNPELTTYGKADLEDGEIQIPANTNTENFRKILMAVNFSDVSYKAGEISNKSVQTLSARLQTEMTKLKRFSIFSIHNRNGVTMVQELGDIGEANTDNIDNRDLQAIDYVLSAAITVTKEKHEKSDHDQLIYEVECDFSCEELKTKTVKFAEKAKGRAVRTQALSLSGKKLGGYNEDEEKQAIYNAAMKAIAVVANKLGNTFPVGGRVTGVSSSLTRFAFDKGFEQGIGKNAQVVLFADDGGLEIPLALGEASPSTYKATTKIYKWNTSDPDAEVIIDDLKKGNWQNYKLYGVQYGMPVPPEWENAYK